MGTLHFWNTFGRLHALVEDVSGVGLSVERVEKPVYLRSGSEVLMGHAEGKSMLYLETRCIAIVRGSGTQGIQNGGIDCTPISASLPGGQLSVMAENLVAMLWDQSITHKRARAEPLVVILQHIEAEHVVKDKLSTELELMFSHLENDEQ